MDASGRETELVFVYGTLRVGASNHRRMRGARWIGAAGVKGSLHTVSWYPGFVPSDDGMEVVGDLFEVKAAMLERLDEFEGLQAGTLVGKEYERRKLRVIQSDDTEYWDPRHPAEVSAWVWVWRKPTDDLLQVASGDWLDVERPRQPPWFTALGCVGLLAIPFGSAGLMLTVMAADVSLGAWTYRIDEDLVVGFLLSATIGFGIGAVWLANRRRERWAPLRGLTVIGAVLWTVIAVAAFLQSLR